MKIEKSRGRSRHPCGTPALRVRLEEVWSSKVQNPITHRKVLMLRSLNKVASLEMMGWNLKLKSINTIHYIHVALGWVEMKASSTDPSVWYRSWWKSSAGEWKSFDVSQNQLLKDFMMMGVMQQSRNHSASKVKSGKVSCPSELPILEKKWEQHLIMWPSLCKQSHNSVRWTRGTWKTPQTVTSIEEWFTNVSKSITEIMKNVS